LAAGVVTAKARVPLTGTDGAGKGGRQLLPAGDRTTVTQGVQRLLVDIHSAMFAARQRAITRCVVGQITTRQQIVDVVAAHRGATNAPAAGGVVRHGWEWPVFVVPWSEGGDCGAAAESDLKSVTGGYTVRCYLTTGEVLHHGLEGAVGLRGADEAASQRACAWTGKPAQHWAVLAKSF